MGFKVPVAVIFLINSNAGSERFSTEGLLGKEFHDFSLRMSAENKLTIVSNHLGIVKVPNFRPCLHSEYKHSKRLQPSIFKSQHLMRYNRWTNISSRLLLTYSTTLCTCLVSFLWVINIFFLLIFVSLWITKEKSNTNES